MVPFFICGLVLPYISPRWVCSLCGHSSSRRFNSVSVAINLRPQELDIPMRMPGDKSSYQPTRHPNASWFKVLKVPSQVGREHLLDQPPDYVAPITVGSGCYRKAGFRPYELVTAFRGQMFLSVIESFCSFLI
ncbi:hypothetical protein F5Y06DRAFT_191239 [Hypoxylon sp. FL0890]|nr:hypothetical protein F5Y06DRAFT_191239 [Hypoxylon sp. FL0890]